MPQSASGLQQQQKKEAAEQCRQATLGFGNFLHEYEADLDTETVFQLLHSHGRLDDFLRFAMQKKNYEAVVLHHINSRNFTQALTELNSIQEQTARNALMVRYSSILMKHVAKATMDSLAKWYREVRADDLLPALMSLETVDRLHAIPYIHDMMDRCTNNLLHNLYVFFLAQSDNPQCGKDLVDFLDQQEALQKKNQPVYLDRDFALNVCKHFGRIEAQIRVYGMLEFYEEAVKLAVRKEKYDIAKQYANMPADEKIRKKLWMEITSKVLANYNSENRTGFEILSECKNLTLGDVMQYVPGKVKLSTFRTDLLSSLQNYGTKLDSIKKSMAEYNKSFQEITDELQEVASSTFSIPGNQYCDSCKGPLLGCDNVYIFPCMHSFHRVSSFCLIFLRRIAW